MEGEAPEINDPQELLNQLVGALTEEDLKDPAIALGLEKIVMLMEGRDELPEEFVAELMEIEDKQERFRMAASSLGIVDDIGLEKLTQTMIEQGLLG